MKNSDLVKNLTAELKPVKPWMSPEKRLGIWYFTHVATMAIYLFATQPLESKVLTDLAKPHFLFENLLFLSFTMSAAYLAFLSVVPGTKPSRVMKFGILTFCLLMGSLLIGFYSPAREISMVGKRAHCLLEVGFLSILPMVSLGLLIRNGVILDKWKTYLSAGLASALIPAGYMHIACMYDPMHIMSFHIAPAIGAGLIGSTIFVLLSKDK